MTQPCPNCEGTLVDFTELPAEDRERLEADPTRAAPVSHAPARETHRLSGL